MVNCSSPRTLVRDWNALKAEYDRLDADWSPFVAGQLSDLKRKMKLIEQACVVSHVMSDRPPDFLQRGMQRYDGQNLRRALNAFDRDAIDALKGRIARNINNDNGVIAQRFLEKHGRELGSMSEKDADHIRLSVSMFIWCFIAAFYEIATLQFLGSPENVYVGRNVRDLFVGLRHRYFQSLGEQIARDDVRGEVTNFSDGLRRNIEGYFAGQDSHLAGVLSVRVGLTFKPWTEDMANTLDREFRTFVETRKASITDLIGHG